MDTHKGVHYTFDGSSDTLTGVNLHPLKWVLRRYQKGVKISLAPLWCHQNPYKESSETLKRVIRTLKRVTRTLKRCHFDTFLVAPQNPKFDTYKGVNRNLLFFE